MVFLWFTEEEINNMKLELDKYGIQMPSFSKIGGLLANELSVDQAAGRSIATVLYHHTVCNHTRIDTMLP